MKKYINKISNITNTTGLGLFLVVGFNGCDGISNDCKNPDNMLSPSKQEECKKKNYIGGTGGSSSSFIPVGGAGASSNSAAKTGFFSEGLHGGSSTGESGHGGFSGGG